MLSLRQFPAQALRWSAILLISAVASRNTAQALPPESPPSNSKKEALKKTHTDAPLEALPEVPNEAPVEAPPEPSTDAQSETPPDAPVESPPTTTEETPTQAPLETPSDTAPTETTTEAPLESPADAPKTEENSTSIELPPVPLEMEKKERKRPKRKRMIIGEVEPEATPGANDTFLFLEPLFGYTIASFGFANVSSVSVNALGGGFRIGGVSSNFQFGLEAQAHNVFGEVETGGAPTETTVWNLQLGLTVAATLSQIPLRFFVGVNFFDQLRMSGSAPLNATTGRFGISYLLGDSIALNVESNIRSYAKKNIGGVLIEPKYNGYFFSLSFPFVFGPHSVLKMSQSSSKTSASSSNSAWDQN